MPKRIYEQYQPGDIVEITLSDMSDKRWQPARVLAQDPPGIWVVVSDGRRWFMTNTFRIRRPQPPAAE